MSRKKDKKNEKSRKKVISTIKKATNVTIVPKDMRENKTSHFEIVVLKKTQKGVDYFSGVLTLEQLAALTNVDTYTGNKSHTAGAGQRILNEGRGRKFMDFIIDRSNVCFSEILMNEREGKVEYTSIQQMGVKLKNGELTSHVGILNIPIDSMLYVYDGQTRRFGYLSLLHFDMDMFGTEDYADYRHMKIPFCLCQVSPNEETKLFLEHNKQTSVASDHKATLSWQTHKHLCEMKHHTATEKVQSIIAGMASIMEEERTNPWYKNISMPEMSIEAHKACLGTQGSFNTGIKRFVGWLNKNYWSPETTIGQRSEDLAAITTTFWRSIQKTCPKIYRNRENYVMWGPVGIGSLGYLMHDLYMDFFNRDMDWTIDNLSTTLKKSSLLCSPKKWEKGEELSKGKGSYGGLEQIRNIIYKQIRNG
jgi:DGQHR domain-containing protein